METIVDRMRADLQQLDEFALGMLFVRVKAKVDHLHECEDCRKERGPEFHAIGVLYLGLIEQEIAARGESIIRIQTSRARSRFAHAMAPSIN